MAVLMLVCLLPAAAQAQLRTAPIAQGLTEPVAFVPDPAFPNVFYVVQQNGLVRVFRDGLLLADPFLDIRTLTVSSGERGLLGMVFMPDGSGRVFINYTNLDGHTVISRYRRFPEAALRADPSTKHDIRWPTGERFIRQPFANHNGGHLAFAQDGFLYIGLGDGGDANDRNNNAQNPQSLLGKMLRIDVNVPDQDDTGYRVPASNPFVDGQPIAAMGEIWDFGLRNPWRYAFDDFGTSNTGALIIADVGQASREEINYEPPGAGGRNYGWRIREGRIATPGVPATTPAFTPLIDPIHDYGPTDGRAVVGGYIYRGQALGSAYQGRYFFGDYMSSRVWSLGLTINAAGEATVANVIEHSAELTGFSGNVSSFGRDLQGELYILTIAGNLLKIVASASTGAPQPPQNVKAIVSASTVTISWSLPSTGPIPSSFVLEAGSGQGKSDLAMFPASATTSSLTFAGVSPGTYFVRVKSVGSGGTSGSSNELVLTVTGGCSGAPPPPTGLTSSVIGSRVVLTWSLPITADGPTALIIEAGSGTGLANLAVITIDGSLQTLEVQAPPGQYFVRIRGRNACGVGPVSNEVVVTVFLGS